MKECISIQPIGISNIFHCNQSVIYLDKIIIDNDGGNLRKLRKLRICNSFNLCACYISVCVICNIFARFGSALCKAVYVNIAERIYHKSLRQKLGFIHVEGRRQNIYIHCRIKISGNNNSLVYML